MPKLTDKYTGLDGIDLDQFPSDIILKHGKGGGREWWEWSQGRGKNRKAIVIQRPNHDSSWVVFFDQGRAIRTLELPVPEQDKARRVIAITFGTFELSEAIKALADLGITAKREETPSRMRFQGGKRKGDTLYYPPL